MKIRQYLLTCLGTLLSLSMNAQTSMSDPSVTSDPNLHIYLCFGQSNMEGAAPFEACDTVDVDPRFRMMAVVDMPKWGRKAGNWYVARPPLCREHTGLTPADYFGRTMVAHLPDSIKVGIVHVAVGGASIDLYDEDTRAAYLATAPDWMQNTCKAYGDNPYRRLVECAREAKKAGVIKGILLHQGCTDSGNTLWPQRVKCVYERLLADLNLRAEDTPLLVGELLQQDQGGKCHGHNAIIGTLPAVIPTARVIPSAGCPGAADGLHFTAEGYRILGKRYAESILF